MRQFSYMFSTYDKDTPSHFRYFASLTEVRKAAAAAALQTNKVTVVYVHLMRGDLSPRELGACMLNGLNWASETKEIERYRPRPMTKRGLQRVAHHILPRAWENRL